MRVEAPAARDQWDWSVREGRLKGGEVRRWVADEWPCMCMGDTVQGFGSGRDRLTAREDLQKPVSAHDRRIA